MRKLRRRAIELAEAPNYVDKIISNQTVLGSELAALAVFQHTPMCCSTLRPPS